MPFAAIAAALYTISLVLPAIVFSMRPILWGARHDELMFGFQCLLLGWGTVPWYANVALGIAGLALTYRKAGVAIVFSVTAIALALTTFLYLGPDLRAPHVGYFAWLASMIVALVASCADRLRSRELHHPA